jgi:hypothetical protein
MIDLIWIGIYTFAAAMAVGIIVEVFRWGYNKENKK